MELVALSLPLLVGVMLFPSLVMLVCRRYRWAFVLLIINLLLNWYGQCFPLNILGSSNTNTATLKVLSFNCNLRPEVADYYGNVDAVADLILKEDADVVFLTENFHHKFDSLFRKIQAVYPYRSKSVNPCGNRLYCKYELLADSLMMDCKENPYAINYCIIKYNNQKVGVIGCHLSSNNYNSRMEYKTPENLLTIKQFQNYLWNILKVGKYRQEQVKTIVSLLDTEIPTVVVGDFNDVFGSPTLNTLERNGLKDSWWEGGFGYGATIHSPMPFRIDHILYNEKLKLEKISKLDNKALSDHDALVAEFEFQ